MSSRDDTAMTSPPEWAREEARRLSLDWFNLDQPDDLMHRLEGRIAAALLRAEQRGREAEREACVRDIEACKLLAGDLDTRTIHRNMAVASCQDAIRARAIRDRGANMKADQPKEDAVRAGDPGRSR